MVMSIRPAAVVVRDQGTVTMSLLASTRAISRRYQYVLPAILFGYRLAIFRVMQIPWCTSKHQNRCVTGKVASGPAERPPESPDHSESRARLITASTDKRDRGSFERTEGDARSASLDLIRRQLTRTGIREQMPLRWPLRRALLLKTVNALNPMLMRTSPFGQRKRDLGLDWPADAETMIGMQDSPVCSVALRRYWPMTSPAIWWNAECGAEGLPS